MKCANLSCLVKIKTANINCNTSTRVALQP